MPASVDRLGRATARPLALALSLLAAGSAHAYNLQTSPLWPASNITINLGLGKPAAPLLDGSTTWAEPIESALADWNRLLGLTQFRSVRDSTASPDRLNGFNTVSFSDTLYGDAWPGFTLAYCTYWWQNGQRTEADVLFRTANAGLAFDWNSYRGSQRGQTYDMRRFALHEFGHALGLDHPNDVGQSVVAVMNSSPGDVDSIMPDDAAGLRVLYPNTAPAIASQPVSQTVNEGASVTFSVVAVALPVASYQWRRDGTAIAGATAATFTINNVTSAATAAYSVVVTCSGGTIISADAVLTVNSRPIIIVPVSSVSAALGATTTLSVTALGTAPFSYQWLRNSTAIAGATNATLTLANLALTDSASYQARVTNVVGAVTSSPITLTVVAPPTITLPPVSQTVLVGARVTLSASTTGNPPITYQWLRNGVPIAGATNLVLTLNSVTTADAGAYAVKVSTLFDSVTSSAATLTVNPPGRLINLSILAALATGETITMGATLGGTGTTGTKPIVVRAVGPSLAQFGLSGILPDPALTLNRTSVSPAVVVESNNDWGGAPILSDAFTRVGAFPYAAANSRDAASFLPTLASGNYTVQVRDTGSGSGSVLAELYDATAVDTLTGATPRLINLSVLKQITAGSTLTAGFVIGGTTNLRVLVRAAGPTLALAPFSLPGVMSDPKLELFNNSTGIKILENDDWGGTSTLSSAFTSVGAFAFANATTKDAALLVTLAPGQYSVRTSAASGPAGLVLVEVYEAP